MKLKLEGKKTLITGSTKGIGIAIAQAFHNQGALLALNGRNNEALFQAVKNFNGSIGVAGDVTNPNEAKRIVAEVIQKLEGIDILVCNVGSGRSVIPGNENFDEWQRVFAANLWATTNIIEAAKETLINAKGNIICISSICGSEVIKGAPITYSAAKAALDSYVRGIARPLGKQGVRINSVAPGNINFEGSIWASKLAEEPNVVKQYINNEVSLGRLGEASEIANLVVFLASPLSSFATGQIWKLDGGQTHS